MDGVLTRCMSLVWRTPPLRAFHDVRRRISTVASTRAGPMLLCTDWYWGQRASRYASECWRPAHPPVSYAVDSRRLYVRFPVLGRFLRGLIGEADYFDTAASDTDQDSGVARVRRVDVCRRAIKPALFRANYRPCYTSTTASSYKWSCLRTSSPLTKSVH